MKFPSDRALFAIFIGLAGCFVVYTNHNIWWEYLIMIGIALIVWKEGYVYEIGEKDDLLVYAKKNIMMKSQKH